MTIKAQPICPNCRGRGFIVWGPGFHDRCSTCGGTGRKPEALTELEELADRLLEGDEAA